MLFGDISARLGGGGGPTLVEGFEHNDLAGNYSGDTGDFDISTATADVHDGTYGLHSPTGSGTGTVWADTASWTLSNGSTFEWWFKLKETGAWPSITFGGDEASDNGYSADATTGDIYLYRFDGGSFTELATATWTHSLDTWYRGVVDWEESTDGTTEFHVDTGDGTTVEAGPITHTDTTYAGNTQTGFYTEPPEEAIDSVSVL